MKKRKFPLIVLTVSLMFALAPVMDHPADAAKAEKTFIKKDQREIEKALPVERKSAGKRLKADIEAALAEGMAMPEPMMEPGAVPHYFGPWANWAYSPLPKGPVTVVELIAGGSGYVAPTVMIQDLYHTGTGATATALVTDGAITGITLDNPGSGYSAPIVYIVDEAGAGAEAVATIGGALEGGIRKFIDSLPGLGPANANNRGQYLPVAVPDKTTYPATGETPAADYYEIGLVEYDEQMHSDLPPTRQRGYVQLATSVIPGSVALTNPNGTPVRKPDGSQAIAVDAPHFLGPVIVAERDKPVRIKFYNLLPTGTDGNLFIPVDTTVMGAGMGPDGGMYTQNRSSVHLHGNNTVWISDGTPHQWITPAGESTAYPKGVSVENVPDMPDPGEGSMTFYYTNAHCARLMFYHDHAYGITRLNVYAGEAAGYLVTDAVDSDLVNGTNNTGVNPGLLKALPGLGIPLIIQDRTFVDATTIAAQDPTWNWGTMAPMANTGDLWYPHVYMPVQNPWDPSGWNAFGRWQYGPWFWPPTTNIMHGPVPNPYYDPINAPWEPPEIPGVPHPSMAMETFMDTPIVNGAAYPYLEVEPKAYRFRILNAANDRFFNLQLYQAYDPATDTVGTGTEVKMIPASVCAPAPVAGWPIDGRDGGVPDPATEGPRMIQIGTEGGFLPEPVELPNQPIDWNVDVTTFDAGLVNKGTLILGTAERADVVIDFSAFAGKTLILYNDSPAPFPAGDPLFDYYTGNPPDLTNNGGAPTTQPGYGPNIRTVMQIRVGAQATTPTPDVTLANLQSVFAKTADKNGVFEVSQDEIIVPDARYNSAYNANFPAQQNVQIFENAKTFTTVSGETATLPFEPKAIQDEMGEAYDEFGRMSGFLGLELPITAAGRQVFVLYPFGSPPVDLLKGISDIDTTPIGALDDGTQIWKITHNGVDTHTIHVHLFNAQLINRVAWDNSIRPPDPNELGWKETFRVSPLQDTIIAFRPVVPDVPFLDQIPNSVRPIDPTMPLGSMLMGGPGGFFDPNGDPVMVMNHMVNFGWEYVYHCHLLSHEEMDMMHAVAMAVPPAAPAGLAAAVTGGGANRQVVLTWQDISLNETGFIVQRALTETGPWIDLATLPAGTTTYSDPIGTTDPAYSYRIFAVNTVGDTMTPGFPTKTANSAFSNTIQVGAVQVQPPAAPTNLTAVFQAGPRVALTWNDTANNETGFIIERAVGAGGFSALVTVGRRNGTGNVTYADMTVSPGATYTYRVAAVNAGGPSAFAISAPVTIPNPPAAPAFLRAAAERRGNSARVTLTWANVPGETGYVIQRATDPGFTANLVVEQVGANTTRERIPNLPRNTLFYFRIQAVNGAGPSAWVNATPFPIRTP